ncbi:MAG: AAA family ATPase [Bosea sp. 32-68-6]|nr:MAG: AAA family ATPase [Bosea sp. 32-68-6]
MDPRINPYAPGAGTPPPELAGRDKLIEDAAIALDRIRAGRAARSLVLYGLRGVGKTVLLNRIRIEAEARGIEGIQIEAPEGRSLPAALAPPEKGLADSGDLDSDLTALLRAIGEAASACGTAIVLYIDELQYVPEDQLASLITALHATSQLQLPVTMMAAGLPQLVGQTGRAKSYAERLFSFVQIDRLDDDAATKALWLPAEKEGVRFEAAAITEIIAQTQGYPYFLQEWGKHSWDVADRSPITGEDAQRATVNALAELDASFFRVRFDRLTPTEKLYVRAMAELGPGPHRSGDIAEQLGRKVTAVAPVRNSLIAKGMIFAPSHGDTAFTVPLFDAFMRRTMPAGA